MEVKMTKLILLVSLGLLGACTISGEVAPPVVVNPTYAPTYSAPPAVIVEPPTGGPTMGSTWEPTPELNSTPEPLYAPIHIKEVKNEEKYLR